MQILLTGGTGFIGSHLTERLISDGHMVTVLDNFSTGQKSNLSKLQSAESLTLVEGSILDASLLEVLTDKTDYIFHLAAAVGVFNIVNKPLESLLTNIRGTENVLAAADKASIPVFLTSSSEVYGKNASNSLKETDDRILGSPLVLRWSYSEAKAIDESLAYAYHIENQLETRIVRFFNTVGPRQLGAYGMVLPRFVKAALENEDLIVYGDGTQTRCFAHIYDVIDAVILVAFSQDTIGKVVNIGNNFEISMNDLAKEIIKLTSSKSKIVHLPYQEAYGAGFEDMNRRVPDLSLIQNLVGWTPKRNLTSIIIDIAEEMKGTIKAR
jgi:UDP-glucose 4-epimerase